MHGVGELRMSQSSGEDQRLPRQWEDFMTATGTARGSWCGCSCSHCGAAMAREGEKERHQNGHPEKGVPKLSPVLETEGGGAAARVVVLDQDGETSSTEGY